MLGCCCNSTCPGWFPHGCCFIDNMSIKHHSTFASPGQDMAHSLYGANFPLSGMATQLSWRSSRFGFLGESAAIWAADSARCVLCRWGSACVWGHCKVNTSMTCTTSIFRYGRAFETEQTRLETQSFKMNSHHRVSLVHFLCRAVPLEFALIAALSDGSFCLSHGGNIWYFP